MGVSIRGVLPQRISGFVVASALAALPLIGTACQNKMYDENTALREQNRELQAKLDERNQIMQSAVPVSNVQTPAPIAPAPVAPAPAIVPPASVEQPVPSISSDLAGLDATENKVTGTMTVKFLGDELFDAGKATLKETSKRDLTKVCAALKKQYTGRPVRIEGHTDSDPIRHSKWASNMELSKARAEEVRRFLVSKGVNAALVTTQGFGDTKPKTSDPTQKAQNRRVEIVVLAR